MERVGVYGLIIFCLLAAASPGMNVQGASAGCDVYIDFTTPGHHILPPTSQYVNWKTEPYGSSSSSCAMKGVIELTPPPGKTAVQLDMTLDEPHTWTFDIGDSVTNNGYCGDYSSTRYDAEIYGVGNALQSCRSDVGGSSYIHQISGAVRTGNFTVQMAKMQMAASNYHNVSVQTVDNGLFFMDTFYVGLNKVVYGTSRTGSGLCSLCVKWADSWEQLPQLGNVCVRPGYYDVNCQYRCSQGCEDTCDLVSGTCRCRDGWTGDKCTLDVDQGQSKSNTDLLVGVAVGLACGLALLIVVVVIYWCCRYQQCQKPQRPKSDDENNSEPPTYSQAMAAVETHVYTTVEPRY